MKLLVLPLLLVSALLAENVAFWKVQKVFSWDALNIRKNADHTSEKIAQIPFDASCIVNHGCGKNIDFEAMGNMQEEEIKAFLAQSKEEWCYVEYDGNSGWVNSYYLTKSNAQCQ